MKKNIKKIFAAFSAVSVIAFGGITASATTAEDVVAAARGAGIRETYVQTLANFLRANKFNSNQYDMMIEGIGNIRNTNLELIQKYFPEIDSYDDIYGGGSSDSSSADKNDSDKPSKPGSSSNSNSNSSSKPSAGTSSDNLTKDEQTIQDLADDIEDKLTHEEMLESINQVISTGKDLGLDITVEQNAEKSFTITVKDKEGNIKLVTPVGKIVSKTGVENNQNDGDFVTVAALCASLLAVGGIGAWVLGRKNDKIEE
jgi:hypothetical protein